MEVLPYLWEGETCMRVIPHTTKRDTKHFFQLDAWHGTRGLVTVLTNNFSDIRWLHEGKSPQLILISPKVARAL